MHRLRRAKNNDSYTTLTLHLYIIIIIIILLYSLNVCEQYMQEYMFQFNACLIHSANGVRLLAWKFK